MTTLLVHTTARQKDAELEELHSLVEGLGENLQSDRHEG